MNRRIIPLPKKAAKDWLVSNRIYPTDELVNSLAEEMKRFFDIGADT